MRYIEVGGGDPSTLKGITARIAEDTPTDNLRVLLQIPGAEIEKIEDNVIYVKNPLFLNVTAFDFAAGTITTTFDDMTNETAESAVEKILAALSR